MKRIIKRYYVEQRSCLLSVILLARPCFPLISATCENRIYHNGTHTRRIIMTHENSLANETDETPGILVFPAILLDLSGSFRSCHLPPFIASISKVADSRFSFSIFHTDEKTGGRFVVFFLCLANNFSRASNAQIPRANSFYVL